MEIRLLQSPAELQAYDAFVRAHEHGSVWQSLAWKTYQESLGREVRIYAAESQNTGIDTAALVVIDRTIGGLSTWEMPRGPLAKDAEAGNAFIDEVSRIAADAKCFAMYLSPARAMMTMKTRPSTRHIQPQATRVIDLTKSEDEILAGMHPKGRYNISLARKHGVEVLEGSENDISAFYTLLEGTGGRDGFVISQKSHYARFLSNLDHSFLLLAKYQGRPVSGLMGLEWNGTAVYYYGASSYADRSLMAPYLLQWEAMRRSKAHSCHSYDLLGISPDKAGPDDPWWGITDFKRKFGGTVVTYSEEQQIVLRPAVKAVLDLKRRILG